jgi:hypothetical protein
MLAAAGLPRLLQTASCNIIEPTVIEAPESPVLDSPVTEIRSAVRTMQPKQSRTLLIVTE